MSMKITDAMAQAEGLAPEDSETVRDLIGVWQDHYERNRLRDAYYYGHVRVKDLGISVSPKLAKRLNPHVDWAAKCVDWWSDRVQFDGITIDDEAAQDAVEAVMRGNDAKNLLHKTVSAALRHSCAFLTVTAGENGETIVSGYPATASAALWDDAKKRIRAGLVVVESVKPRDSHDSYPRTVYVFDDRELITLSRDSGQHWRAEYTPHSMGRVPMEPIAYHQTLERPFGRSRITRSVMSLVDDAQREMMNMAAAASFSAAPQKFLLGADRKTAEKMAGTPFEAFMGSVFVSTTNSKGQIPQYGQLAQLTMQPHTEYLRDLAAQFSGTTGVPLSSLGVVSDNPSSAEAIFAGKEDAVVDIQSFIDGVKRSMANISTMVLAAENNTDFDAEKARGLTIDVHFRKPDRPSVVSQSDAVVKQISAIPWLADSDIALRELGYDDEQVHQLRGDRERSQASGILKSVFGQTAQQGAVSDGSAQPDNAVDDGD